MRVRIEVTTQAKVLPWPKVLAPGHGVVYKLLAETDPALADQVHNDKWGPHRMTPFGHSAPVFPSAQPRRGQYAAGGSGYIEFGSPVPEIAAALVQGLCKQEHISWGGIGMRILGMQLMEPPVFANGVARFRTETPVTMKSSVRIGADGAVGRSWVLPNEPEFPAMLQRNLERKAETLGMPADIELREIPWIGRKRSFTVVGGSKPGAEVAAVVCGAPRVLQAIWSWGLGQQNSAGFGWIRARC